LTEHLAQVPPGLWVLLAGLLALSGAFSATETALFSLAQRDRDRAGPSLRWLLARPRDLLVAVLFGNLVVNVLFFTFALRLIPPDDAVGDWVVGLGALLAVLVAGEILPKTVGLRASAFVAPLTAPVLRYLVQLLGPLRVLLSATLERSVALFGRRFREESGMTPQALAGILERSATHGVLLDSEADILVEIIELDGIRVREIMTPRVDTLYLDLGEADRERMTQEALAKRLSWLPVMDGNPDRIVGQVRVRDLVNRADRPLTQLVMPVKFVPEVASALDLLRGLRDDRVAEAIVVDEWGGTAGSVTIEDIFEEIVGELRSEGESREPPAIPLGEGVYRVSGSLSIRDWNEEFDVEVVPTEFETVGGFVTALLGRIPRTGDEVRFGPLAMQVQEVRGRRVLSVDMRVVTEEGVAR